MRANEERMLRKESSQMLILRYHVLSRENRRNDAFTTTVLARNLRLFACVDIGGGALNNFSVVNSYKTSDDRSSSQW